MKKLIPIIALLLFCGQSYSQGFSTYSKLSEFEAQRFLMNEVYEISTTQIDRLRIDFTYKEIDPEGFIFRLTSYEFNGKIGVVITTMNTYDNLSDNIYQFRNIHLSKEQFEELNKKFNFLNANIVDKNIRLIQRINDRFIIEITRTPSGISYYYILWIDDKNRHTFKKEDWADIFMKFQKFVSE